MHNLVHVPASEQGPYLFSLNYSATHSNDKFELQVRERGFVFESWESSIVDRIKNGLLMLITHGELSYEDRFGYSEEFASDSYLGHGKKAAQSEALVKTYNALGETKKRKWIQHVSGDKSLTSLNEWKAKILGPLFEKAINTFNPDKLAEISRSFQPIFDALHQSIKNNPKYEKTYNQVKEQLDEQLKEVLKGGFAWAKENYKNDPKCPIDEYEKSIKEDDSLKNLKAIFASSDEMRFVRNRVVRAKYAFFPIKA